MTDSIALGLALARLPARARSPDEPPGERAREGGGAKGRTHQGLRMRTASARSSPRPLSHPCTAATVAENKSYLPLGAIQDSDRQSGGRPRPPPRLRAPQSVLAAQNAHPFNRAASHVIFRTTTDVKFPFSLFPAWEE